MNETSKIVYQNATVKVGYLYDYISRSSERACRYTPTPAEQEIQEDLWAFKKGHCTEEILEGLVAGVRKYATPDTLVCFVPASSAGRTRIRFAGVAEEIQRQTGIPCTLEAVTRKTDALLPGHQTGKKADPLVDFFYNRKLVEGKRIILIDDLITTGGTIEKTAQCLMNNGARGVTGLTVGERVILDNTRDTRNLEKIYW